MHFIVFKGENFKPLKTATRPANSFVCEIAAARFLLRTNETAAGGFWSLPILMILFSQIPQPVTVYCIHDKSVNRYGKVEMSIAWAAEGSTVYS